TILLIAQSATSPVGDILISFGDANFEVTTVFSEVDTFQFDLSLDGLLETRLYEDPAFIQLDYSVSGTLVAGTPSGFPAFMLSRTIAGPDFYTQGSSLRFEIAPNAVLDDGIQVAELVGTGDDVVFRFDGREIDNGRFHPALVELRADGTGRIQNSNNVPSLNPLNEVAFGAEYITDLVFDPGNTTIITGGLPPAPPTDDGGGGAMLWLIVGGLGWLRLRRLRA
ncbi:MAG: hypothetical protein AB8G16_13345, partial [Gammaproteobacteria bacterium]